MSKMKNIMIYKSWKSSIEKMSDEQAGQLLKAIYAIEDDPDAEPEDDGARIFFAIVKDKLMEDAESYDEICRGRSEAGKKSGEARRTKRTSVDNDEQKATHVRSVEQEPTKRTNTKTKTNTNTNINPLTPLKRGNARMCAPTREEVAEYCKARGNSVDPDAFVDFYESNGWKVGKNPMKDWKAAVRTWEQRKKEDAGRKAEKPPNKFHNFAERTNSGLNELMLRKQMMSG